MERFDAIVIGADPNGLIAATYLAKAGRRTLLLEPGPGPGGPLRRRDIAGLGPGRLGLSLEFRLDRAVLRDLQLDRHGLALRPVSSRAVLTEAGPVILERTPGAALERLAKLAPGEGERLLRFRRDLIRLRRFAERLEAPLDIGGGESRAGRLAKLVAGAGGRDAQELASFYFASVAEVLESAFRSPPLRTAIAALALTGAPVGPYAGGSAAYLLDLPLTDEGEDLCWGYSEGVGPAGLVDALAAAAARAGVVFGYGITPTEVRIKDNEVRGVVVASGERYAASVVVSSWDVKRSILTLLHTDHVTREGWADVVRLRATGLTGRAVFRLRRPLKIEALAQHGVDEEAPLVLARSLHAMEEAFDRADLKVPPMAPWLSIDAPMPLDPAAPTEGVSQSVSVHAVSDRLAAEPWDAKAKADVLALVVKQIDAAAPGFAASIEAAQIWFPGDLEAETGLTGGSFHDLDRIAGQLGPARPLPGLEPTRLSVDGFFLCGQGAFDHGRVWGPAARFAAKLALEHGTEGAAKRPPSKPAAKSTARSTARSPGKGEAC